MTGKRENKMKKLKTLQAIVGALLITGLTLSFTACSEQSPFEAATENQNVTLAKRTLETQISYITVGETEAIITDSQYPQSASRTLYYQSDQGDYDYQGHYEGGNMNVPGGSTFNIREGALTPPPGTPIGQEVTLTMLVEKDDLNNELIFSFGPSGCTFDPPAEVWFDYTDSGSRNVTLFYIDENGNYIPQEPARVDKKGQRMKLFIDHFSRYAFAWAE
jgi:hypothetical protein